MSFITNLRVERHLAEIRTSPDRTRPATAHAISRLKILGAADPEVIEDVIAELPHADQTAAAAFTEVLAALITERTFPAYLRGLMRGNPRANAVIARALTTARNYPPFLLLEALDTPRVPKAALLEVITAHKARFTAHELLRAAYTQSTDEKAALFRILGDIARDQDLPLLISHLSSRDTMARVHLINVLSRFPTPEVSAALTALLKNPDKTTRGAVLHALKHMEGPLDVPAICALLRDRDIEVQNRAVDLLSLKANEPPTVPHLLDVLLDGSGFSRRAAIDVLIEIKKGPRHLLEALKSKDWKVRGRINHLLGRIGGSKLLQATLRLVQDPDESVRRSAIDILSHANDQSAVNWLLEATADRDEWVSARAVDALAEIGNKRAVPALLELLESPRPVVLPSVVRALGRLGDAQHVAALMPFLKHEQREVRIEAIQALANLVDEARAGELITSLKELQGSPDQTVARIAYFSIEVIESRAADVALAVGASGPSAQSSLPPPPARASVSSNRANLRVRPAWTRPEPGTPAATPEPAPAPMPQAPSPVGLDIQRLQPGDMLESRYRFIERIGRGAFGTVLLTEDTVVGERLILKFINQNLATDEEVVRRFMHELRYSRRVTHQNVIRIYDFHNIQGSYAISMEYFHSHTLAAELVQQEPLPFARVLKVAIDICNGMEAAHEQGIVHRDLKPANVLIGDEDDSVKVVDFGVAAALRETNNADDDLKRRRGFVIGSPKYMAPEQTTGQTIDHRADIYALGVMLYEMATGVPPYDGREPYTIMRNHVQGKARPPIELNPQLLPQLNDLIMRAMAVNKSRRFQSMAALRAALRQLK